MSNWTEFCQTSDTASVSTTFYLDVGHRCCIVVTKRNGNKLGRYERGRCGKCGKEWVRTIRWDSRSDSGWEEPKP